MFSVLKVSDEKIRDKMIANVKERVTSIALQKPGISKELVLHALMQGFTRGKSFGTGTLTKAESARAMELVNERYRKKEWNWMR
jgi:lipoate-protein ligase A